MKCTDRTCGLFEPKCLHENPEGPQVLYVRLILDRGNSDRFFRIPKITLNYYHPIIITLNYIITQKFTLRTQDDHHSTFSFFSVSKVECEGCVRKLSAKVDAEKKPKRVSQEQYER